MRPTCLWLQNGLETKDPFEPANIHACLELADLSIVEQYALGGAAPKMQRKQPAASLIELGDGLNYMVQSVIGEGAWATVYLAAPATGRALNGEEASPLAMKVRCALLDFRLWGARIIWAVPGDMVKQLISFLDPSAENGSRHRLVGSVHHECVGSPSWSAVGTSVSGMCRSCLAPQMAITPCMARAHSQFPLTGASHPTTARCQHVLACQECSRVRRLLLPSHGLPRPGHTAGTRECLHHS